MAKFYISSTYEDLKDERRAVTDAILKLGHHPIGMEHYHATRQRPLDKCLEDVRSCQAYIGLFAWRYGYVPPSEEKSITHLEYEEAVKRKLHLMIFLLHEGAKWPSRRKDADDKNIRQLREKFKKTHAVMFFKNTDKLESAVIASIARELGTASEIPPLLPYLADRNEQEEALEESLYRLKESPPCPLISVVHGDEFQSHDKFLERLKNHMLPKLLESSSMTKKLALSPAQVTIKEYALKWPPRLRVLMNIEEKLQRNLARLVLGESSASLEKLVKELADHRFPVLIHTHLLSEDFNHHGPELLKRFLKFWQNWPDLYYGQVLVVILFIKYEMHRKLGFFKKRRSKALNKMIQDSLDNFQFSEFDRLICTVLPKLKALNRHEVEEWARSREVMNYCKNQDIFPYIRNLFHSSATVPMEFLAEELKNILLKFSTA